MTTRIPQARSERLTAATVFLLLVACYSFVFPRWADPNQNSRLDMVFAVVEDGTLQIDSYVANTVDYARVGDHYYSDKAPGVAFLGIPVYAAIKPVLASPILNGLMTRLAANEAFQATLRPDGSGLLEKKVRFAIAQVIIALVVGVIPSGLLGALIYLWLAQTEISTRARLVLALSYGLLTPAFAYANSLYGHQLSAALLFGVFYWFSTARRPMNTGALVTSGMMLSYAVVTEYPTALIAGPIYLYALHRLHGLGQTKGIVPVTLAAAAVAAGWMYYNAAVFGSPLTLGYSYSELWLDKHQTGFISLTMPHWEATWGITFGVFRGLFVYSPYLLFVVPGFALWWRAREHRREFMVVIASTLTMFVFNASSVMWWGGFAVGPRYLLPMLPFTVLPIAYALRQWGSQMWLKGTMGVLLGWSFIATWGLSLAGQAFPSDLIRNPLLNYALPNWRVGNIARNAGTILGLHGPASLLPLALLIGLIGMGYWRLSHLRSAPQAAKPPLAPKQIPSR